MIYVECIVMDMTTGMMKGRYYKEFQAPDDFNKWYAIVKRDGDTAINCMRYNFNINPGLKAVHDAKLSRLPRVERELST
jgi:hypothetical protein